MDIKKANQNVIKYTYRRVGKYFKTKRERKKINNNAEHRNVWFKFSVYIKVRLVYVDCRSRYRWIDR